MPEWLREEIHRQQRVDGVGARVTQVKKIIVLWQLAPERSCYRALEVGVAVFGALPSR